MKLAIQVTKTVKAGDLLVLFPLHVNDVVA